MSVGFTVDTFQINTNSGNLSKQIELWSRDVITFKEYLDSAPDADLMAPPFNYTQEDVAILKSGFTDLALLARIYQGNDVLITARDLGIFSRRMAGIVL